MKREWWLVILAGVIEVVWVSGLKHGSTWWEWLITLMAILLRFKVLLEGEEKLPLGTVYAVFTGLGTAGTVLSEMLLFGEPVEPLKLVFIGTLAAGVISLKLVTKDEKAGEA